MIRKIIIFTIILFSGQSFAQKIETDRLIDDGRRQVISSSLKQKLNDSEYFFTVEAYERNSYINWFLLISSYNEIPYNATLLVKLGNDEVLNLPINNHNQSEITRPAYSYMIGNIIYNTPSRSTDYYMAIFYLSDRQCKQIEKYGITKIRISSQNSFNEKKWTNNKLGKFITKCRKKMSERLATTRIKSITDNF